MPQMKSDATVHEFAAEAIRRLCDRCRDGAVAVRTVSLAGNNTTVWTHQRRPGMFVAMCDATVIHEMIAEMGEEAQDVQCK